MVSRKSKSRDIIFLLLMIVGLSAGIWQVCKYYQGLISWLNYVIINSRSLSMTMLLLKLFLTSSILPIALIVLTTIWIVSKIKPKAL